MADDRDEKLQAAKKKVLTKNAQVIQIPRRRD